MLFGFRERKQKVSRHSQNSSSGQSINEILKMKEIDVLSKCDMVLQA